MPRERCIYYLLPPVIRHGGWYGAPATGSADSYGSTGSSGGFEDENEDEDEDDPSAFRPLSMRAAVNKRLPA
ncbi:MAG: hypothetical protein ACOYD3_10665 [Kiritimatiellia bacterium]|jgi:hypothetical protein